MPDDYTLWTRSYTWHIREQSRAIESLEGSLASTRSQTSRLRSQLSSVQGDLNARLNRLAKAFDAFVELSDLRMELVAFAGAAKVRHHATATIAALAGDTPLPAAPQDVPGYWLAPATSALQKIVADGSQSEDLVSEALARDARRTATFLCLVLPMVGRHDRVRPAWLESAFGELNGRERGVTKAQRQLWITAAYGAYGSAGRNLLLERLAAGVPRPNPGSWIEPLAAAPSTNTLKHLANDNTIRDQQRSVARLTAVRRRLSEITSREDPPGPPEPQETVGLLQLLVSEGSPAERELLARAAELRKIISSDGVPTHGTIDDPAGSLEEILIKDLAGDDPLLAQIALVTGAEAVRSGTESLTARATAPPPHEVTLTIDHRHEIAIRADGPAPESMEAVERNIARRTMTPDLRPGPDLFVAAGLAAVGAVMIFIHWALILPFAVLAAVFVGRSLSKRREAAGQQRWARESAAKDMAKVHERTAEAAKEFAAYLQEAETSKIAAQEELTAITGLLPAAPR